MRCWAEMQFGTAKKAAASLSPATVRYIRERAAGASPAVPDVLWNGNDCWLLHNKSCQAFGRQVRDVVIHTAKSAPEPKPRGAMMSAGADGRQGSG